jgi:hypothetical protein
MTTTDEETMQYLDEFIRTGGTMRPIAKAVKDDVDVTGKESHPNDFPATREGLASFAKSAGMQTLKRQNPAAFREKYLGFVSSRELVSKGLVTPTEVGTWFYKLGQLPGISPQEPGALHKAVTHTSASPKPWEFDATPRGLQGFLHSPEMTALVRERPSLYRSLYLDFFASIKPAPTPQAISTKRQELEMLVPDDMTQSTVAKSVSPNAHLSYGQSVIAQNFGPDFAPSAWLRQ